MKLTKEFVNSCRRINVLRDFLCQAIDQVDALEEERRWRKFSEEKPPKYTWCLVSGKSQMGKYIVIMDFFEEDDWAENPSLDDDTLDIEYWMPLPSAPKEE